VHETIIMSLSILGIGTAVPGSPVTQKMMLGAAINLLEADEERTAVLMDLYGQTEIDSRHMFDPQIAQDIVHHTTVSGSPFCTPGADGLGPDTEQRMAAYMEHAPPLARMAAARALDESGLSPAEVTHLVTVSCTGFRAPGFDISLMKTLELAPTVARTHIGFMGCHGAFNGLRVARAFADADPAARILLCAVELCSIHYHYPWNPKRLVGNALFADGAAALVGKGESTSTGWQVCANGSYLVPKSEFAMNWTVGNHGFGMELSAKVPRIINDNLRGWLEPWLRGHGLALADVGSWAVHPGGPRILTAVESALGVDRAQTRVSREVLAKFGNMSSPTMLFIVQRLRAADAPLPCVALGFGPGLMAEAVLFR
jgi:predicted naringenin-chalcone synthase